MIFLQNLYNALLTKREAQILTEFFYTQDFQNESESTGKVFENLLHLNCYSYKVFILQVNKGYKRSRISTGRVCYQEDYLVLVNSIG